MTLRELQSLIRRMYHDKDAARGVEGTFMWLSEEVGELAEDEGPVAKGPLDQSGEHDATPDPLAGLRVGRRPITPRSRAGVRS